MIHTCSKAAHDETFSWLSVSNFAVVTKKGPGNNARNVLTMTTIDCNVVDELIS